MTNRINGDFDSESIEAFRAAYAAQMANPEEHEIDPFNGLPTDVVSNTSPWLEHTGLWKANDGMSRDFKPNQPFNPADYLPEGYGSDELSQEDEPEEEYDSEEEYDDSEEEEPMSDEEYNALTEKIWGSSDNDEVSEDEEVEEVEEEVYYDPGYEEDTEEEELNDEEIEALIDQILNDEGEDEEGEEAEGEYGYQDGETYEDDEEEE
jgi:hypothetical protein